MLIKFLGRHGYSQAIRVSSEGELYTRLVDDPRARSTAKELARNTPSLAGFVILLALKGRTPGLQHHNVWFPRDYDAEFDAIFSRAAVPVDDPAIYVCAPDDPLMRPDPDSEAWFVLVNAPRHEATSTAGRLSPGTIDWDAPGLRDSYADHVLARGGLVDQL